MTLSMELHEPAELGMSASRLADAGALMNRQFDLGSTPMAVALVARHAKVVWAHAVGDASPGGPPVTIDSVFPLASQTKPMTAAVIMALAERGMIGLTESASATLPELADDHRDVMVFHLLTHTSGWNDDDHVAAREAKLAEAVATIPDGADALTHITLWPGWGVPRRLPAGERMQYCNFNYSLLGEIVRRVTGDTLDAAMRRYLFEPIGMTSSAVIVDDGLRSKLIERPPGIPLGPGHAETPLSTNHPLWEASDDGAGGAFASVVDLARFWQMFLDGGMVGATRGAQPRCGPRDDHQPDPGHRGGPWRGDAGGGVVGLRLRCRRARGLASVRRRHVESAQLPPRRGRRHRRLDRPRFGHRGGLHRDRDGGR
jgi:serine-type D-Ala-D-Ala carboxypeptidase